MTKRESGRHGADLALVRRAASADPEAGRAIAARVRRVFRGQVRVLSRRAPWLRSHEEDLLQRFSLDLFKDEGRSLSTWSGEAPFDAWVRVIATRFLRRQAGRLTPRATSLDRPDDLVDPGASPEALAMRASRAAAVRRVLDELSESDRALLALLYDQEVPAHEAGRTLGLSASGVRMRKSRLLERLAKKLGPIAREDEP